MGFPLVTIQGGEPKISNGIVNSITGVGNDVRFFQISVPIQSGNSGGPLVTREGNVIGVVTAKLDAIKVLARTGDLPQNVNYAIKSNYLLDLLSTIPELETQLAKPRTHRFSELEQLAAFVSPSIAIVVASLPERASASVPAQKVEPPPEPPKPVSVFSQLPPTWRSLQSGIIYRYRYLGDQRVYFEAVNPTFPYTAMSFDGQISGKRVFGINYSVFGRGCTDQASFELSLVSPSRIEGFLDGCLKVNVICSCGQRGRLSFTWIPN